MRRRTSGSCQRDQVLRGPVLLTERERFRALSINGVAQAEPVLIGFGQWRNPGGGATPVFIVGSNPRTAGLHPWNLVQGSVEALAIPDGVAVDQSYFERLGVAGLGANAEIRDQKVRVTAVTKGIRSFTTTPFVFTTLDRARSYVGHRPARPPISWCALRRTRRSEAVQPAAGKPLRRRGAHDG